MVRGADGPSESTRQLVEAETRRIVNECYVRAIDELRANRDRLDRLAAALLDHETLDQDDVYRVAGFERVDEAVRAPSPAAASASEVQSN